MCKWCIIIRRPIDRLHGMKWRGLSKIGYDRESICCAKLTYVVEIQEGAWGRGCSLQGTTTCTLTAINASQVQEGEHVYEH